MSMPAITYTALCLLTRKCEAQAQTHVTQRACRLLGMKPAYPLSASQTDIIWLTGQLRLLEAELRKISTDLTTLLRLYNTVEHLVKLMEMILGDVGKSAAASSERGTDSHPLTIDWAAMDD